MFLNSDLIQISCYFSGRCWRCDVLVGTTKTESGIDFNESWAGTETEVMIMMGGQVMMVLMVLSCIRSRLSEGLKQPAPSLIWGPNETLMRRGLTVNRYLTSPDSVRWHWDPGWGLLLIIYGDTDGSGRAAWSWVIQTGINSRIFISTCIF